jgi:hypothetical protein
MLDLNKLEKELNSISEDTDKESLMDFIKTLQLKIKEENRRIKYPFELFGIECGYGWYGLVLPLYFAIQKYNKDKFESEQIHIDQIKEKFGELRFYISNAPEEFQDWASRIEDESYKVCEFCGSTTDVTTEGRGWITTQCKQCRNKKNHN